MPQPKPKAFAITVHVDEDDKGHVETMATELKISLSAAAGILLRRGIGHVDWRSLTKRRGGHDDR